MPTQQEQLFEERVRQRAHLIWESEGRPEGKAQEHWKKAEEEIKFEHPRSWVDLVDGQQRRFHADITWAKERLDEMDAALGALEREARGVQPAARAKIKRLIADLHKQRDEFRHGVMTEIQAGGATWQRSMSQLQVQLDGFIARLTKHIGVFEKQAGAQQRVFRDLAAAQSRAWRDAAEKIHGSTVEFAAERGAEVKRIAQKMEVDASKTESQLREMIGAGKESWSAVRDALRASRAVFDRAVKSAGDAFKLADERSRSSAKK
jgi:DUF2934 family protein